MRYSLGRIFGALAVTLMVFGCMTTGGNAKSAGSDRDALERKYPEGAYLRATGSDRTEAGARNRALTELSRIFVSRIKSETTDSINSVAAGGQESIRQSMNMRVNVLSATELEGVEIAGLWQEGSTYYAMAVLERQSAARGFQAKVTETDNLIRAELEAAKSSSGGRLVRYRSLVRASNLWADRAVLVSRLNVLGYGADSAIEADVRDAIRELVRVKSSMKLYLAIEGGTEMGPLVAEGLGQAGFVISKGSSGSDVLISGSAQSKPIDMKDPDWKYARATVSISVSDSLTGEVVGEVSDNVRASKVTRAEADEAAIRKLAPKVIEGILGILGGDKSN